MNNWTCTKGAFWNTSEIYGANQDRLGEDQDGNLWIAKFVSDHNNDWHGYPVRPVKSDIPPAATIKAWCEAKRIDISDARRMQKGQL